LLDGAVTILERIKAGQQYADIQFAVASRTKSVDWAVDLLQQFGLTGTVFSHQEIFPGNKDRHFANLAVATGFQFAEMLFFDDARDGPFGNCVPVANLGVLAVHCPQVGIVLSFYR
jgi:Acid Phosphatase